jgi:hypothetical protein
MTLIRGLDDPLRRVRLECGIPMPEVIDVAPST